IWYACKRQAALGLDPFHVESKKRYCVDNHDALLVAIETLLDGAPRFRVTELNEDTLTILDLGWNMSADIPKEFLRNRAFDLFSWFELNAKEPEMVSSDPDFEYLTDCTDPDMPPLMDADSDSDSEDGYSTDDTEEEYLRDGDRVNQGALEGKLEIKAIVIGELTGGRTHKGVVASSAIWRSLGAWAPWRSSVAAGPKPITWECGALNLNQTCTMFGAQRLSKKGSVSPSAGSGYGGLRMLLTEPTRGECKQRWLKQEVLVIGGTSIKIIPGQTSLGLPNSQDMSRFASVLRL
ncbi:hypothetical protein DFH09DRAFT_1104913, partial [Mycena vulgaris]